MAEKVGEKRDDAGDTGPAVHNPIGVGGDQDGRLACECVEMES